MIRLVQASRHVDSRTPSVCTKKGTRLWPHSTSRVYRGESKGCNGIPFRFIQFCVLRHYSRSGRIYLSLYGAERDFLLFIEGYPSRDEQRSAFVNFSVSEVQLNCLIGQEVRVLELPNADTTYRVNLCSKEQISAHVVDCCRGSTDMLICIF
jgi:hypothetical protein